MARGTVPLTPLSRAGVAAPAETNGDATNGHTVTNNGRMFLLVHNAGTTVSRTVTLRLSAVHDGQSVTPKTVALAQSTSRYIGPFPQGEYGDQLLVDVDNAELKLSAFSI